MPGQPVSTARIAVPTWGTIEAMTCLRTGVGRLFDPSDPVQMR